MHGNQSMYAVNWRHYTPSSRSLVSITKQDKEALIAKLKAELAKLDDHA